MRQTPQATRILAEVHDLLRDHDRQADGTKRWETAALGGGLLRFDTVGARIEVGIFFWNPEYPATPAHRSPGHIPHPGKPRGWVWNAIAVRGAPKPHLYLHSDGTWQEGANWMALPSVPGNNQHWEPLDYTSIACDLAEHIDEAITKCLLVHRRYVPGQHVSCTQCPQQIHCLANAKPRPKKAPKK